MVLFHRLVAVLFRCKVASSRVAARVSTVCGSERGWLGKADAR
jgi:hypothetical protein